MRFLLEKISKLNIGWNERPLTERDAYELCVRLDVIVQELPITSDGFYFQALDRHVIAVNSRLDPRLKLKVLFHEIAHLLFHAPVSGPAAAFHQVGRRTRQEVEADAFALCALIPRHSLELGRADDLIECVGAELFDERVTIFHKHGF